MRSSKIEVSHKLPAKWPGKREQPRAPRASGEKEEEKEKEKDKEREKEKEKEKKKKK